MRGRKTDSPDLREEEEGQARRDVGRTKAPRRRRTLSDEAGSVLLLVVLYMIQGVPLGLSMGSMPFLMQARMSYTAIGLFSVAAYPYSFKLLWSPIVDSVYSSRVGRRRSWILPLQTASALLMLCCGGWAESRLAAGDAPAITAFFFALVILAATQDIAVDGWALTLLSKDNVGYASTCQTVGMNLGYFTSFTVFLALNDASFSNKWLRRGHPPQEQGVMSLEAYLRFWGWAYLLITAGVALFTRERSSGGGGSNSSRAVNGTHDGVESPAGARRSARLAQRQREGTHDMPGTNGSLPGEVEAVASGDAPLPLREAYLQLWRVVRLPAVRLLALVLVVCRLGMLPAEAVAPLKLLEKGVSKEALAGLVLVEFPLELVSAVVAGRWAATRHPFHPWLSGYRTRLCLAAATTAAVAAFPTGAVGLGDAPAAFAAVALLGVATSFCGTLMFTALGSFYNKISDPSMGGAYLTLLNTIANLGFTLPKFLIFAAIDWLSVRDCPTLDTPPRQCKLVRDGFYPLAALAVACGAGILLWLQRVLPQLEALPLTAWHARAPGRGARSGKRQ